MYKILIASSIDRLEEDVNKYVGLGTWIPTGGVSITNNGNYMQAIYKP